MSQGFHNQVAQQRGGEREGEEPGPHQWERRPVQKRVAPSGARRQNGSLCAALTAGLLPGVGPETLRLKFGFNRRCRLTKCRIKSEFIPTGTLFISHVTNAKSDQFNRDLMPHKKKNKIKSEEERIHVFNNFNNIF